MEIITEQELQEITYKIVLHSKKVNTYTNVELVMLYKLNTDPEFIVNKKMVRVYNSATLEGALERYNKIQTVK